MFVIEGVELDEHQSTNHLAWQRTNCSRSHCLRSEQPCTSMQDRGRPDGMKFSNGECCRSAPVNLKIFWQTGHMTCWKLGKSETSEMAACRYHFFIQKILHFLFVWLTKSWWGKWGQGWLPGSLVPSLTCLLVRRSTAACTCLVNICLQSKEEWSCDLSGWPLQMFSAWFKWWVLRRRRHSNWKYFSQWHDLWIFYVLPSWLHHHCQKRTFALPPCQIQSDISGCSVFITHSPLSEVHICPAPFPDPEWYFWSSDFIAWLQLLEVRICPAPFPNLEWAVDSRDANCLLNWGLLLCGRCCLHSTSSSCSAWSSGTSTNTRSMPPASCSFPQCPSSSQSGKRARWVRTFTFYPDPVTAWFCKSCDGALFWSPAVLFKEECIRAVEKKSWRFCTSCVQWLTRRQLTKEIILW